MSITVLFDVEFKADAVADARRIMSQALVDTRAFDGCLEVEVFIDEANPAHWVITEEWQSMEHDKAYRVFRDGPGAIGELGAILAGPPKLTYLTKDSAI
ncbi:antibiotic biosynthesis monooxygenase [Gordonia sp. zg691]|uniref:Antibiotic biosynthesis monooxygenase n=1 Tax=Gordonia jinghuaiqii TaxID=2758710 RepID=A0A7D7QXF6_9ACTN|nr:antibiotic biosynthesis monooxygenase [Gordonia jinghuaiqii]MBD0862917.1 antibiotic biosynthesis monooxygenase [Gordonia jinghuaiqii]MCR5978958.1 antibiotic biosynthesis monooxygenase [Gordonia jinghuaiqii]QMT01709.1 antibiotic biosynthesis monooxygenase [Gordonia jinghuaiqii]